MSSRTPIGGISGITVTVAVSLDAPVSVAEPLEALASRAPRPGGRAGRVPRTDTPDVVGAGSVGTSVGRLPEALPSLAFEPLGALAILQRNKRRSALEDSLLAWPSSRRDHLRDRLIRAGARDRRVPIDVHDPHSCRSCSGAYKGVSYGPGPGPGCGRTEAPRPRPIAPISRLPWREKARSTRTSLT